jgi:hypothetical protein
LFFIVFVCLQTETDPLASLNREELLETLQVVDAVLAQNTYLDKLLMYRNVKPLEIQESATLRKAAAAEAAAAEAEGSGVEAENSTLTSITAGNVVSPIFSLYF